MEDDFIEKEQEKFERSVISLVEDWKTGQVMTGLDGLLSNYGSKGCLPEFISGAKEFYQSERLQEVIGKYEQFGPEFFSEMFSQYVLTIGCFNSEVRRVEIASFLKLNDEGEPTIIKWDGKVVRNDYFGARFYGRIIELIQERGMLAKTYNIDELRETPLEKASVSDMDISDFTIFAKAIHYSLPLDRPPMNSSFELRVCGDGFVISNRYD